MTEEDRWPVCPECGQKHPRTADLYHAVLEDLFDQNEEVVVSLTPENLYTIRKACEHLEKIAPKLEGKIHAFYGELTSSVDNANSLGVEEIPYLFTMRNLAITLMALKEINIEDDDELLDSVADVNSKINEELNPT